MLGIFIPPKVRKRGTTHYKALTRKEREEMKRATKNEKGRNDRELMKSARKAIAEFFGMERATKREILATVCYSKFTH